MHSLTIEITARENFYLPAVHCRTFSTSLPHLRLPLHPSSVSRLPLRPSVVLLPCLRLLRAVPLAPRPRTAFPIPQLARPALPPSVPRLPPQLLLCQGSPLLGGVPLPPTFRFISPILLPFRSVPYIPPSATPQQPRPGPVAASMPARPLVPGSASLAATPVPSSYAKPKNKIGSNSPAPPLPPRPPCRPSFVPALSVLSPTPRCCCCLSEGGGKVSSHYKSLIHSYTKGNFAGLYCGNKAVIKDRDFSSAAQMPETVSRSEEAGR